MKTQAKKRIATGWVRAGVVALVGLAVIAGVLLWARGNSGATETTSNATTTTMMQTNEGGQITVKVTWQGRNAGPVFSVEMDTHVVNLDGYDEVAAIYDDFAKVWDQRIAAPALAYVNHLIEEKVKPGAVILDAGAGTGERTLALLEHSQPGEVIALDASEIMLAVAKSKIHDPRVRFVQDE